MATSFTERMIGAAKFDVHVYEEVEADTSATGQAMTVVVLYSVAAGIGSLAQTGVIGLVAGVIGGLIGWFIWALLIFVVGTKILPEPQTSSNMGELLRTIGFAASPGLLLVLSAIPLLGILVSLLVFFWMIGTTVVAVRQALDYKSTGRAVAVCVLAAIVPIILLAGLFIGLALMAGLAAR